MSSITIIDKAIHIAKGCHDYNGGWAFDREREIYHHGIQTVISALEAWREMAELTGASDHQVDPLARLGALEELAAESQKLGLYDSPLPIELL